jgi:hypothetical protein
MALSEPGKLQARVPTTRSRKNANQITAPGAPARPVQSATTWSTPTETRPSNLSAGQAPSGITAPSGYGAALPPLSRPSSPVGMARSSRPAPNETRTQMIGGHPSAVRFSSGAPRPELMVGRSAAEPNRPWYQGGQSGAWKRPIIYDHSRLPASTMNPFPASGFAQGGEIPPSPLDTQPAMLQPGEYVLPKWLVEDIKAGSPPGSGGEGPTPGSFVPGLVHGGGVRETGAAGTFHDNDPRKETSYFDGAVNLATQLGTHGWAGYDNRRGFSSDSGELTKKIDEWNKPEAGPAQPVPDHYKKQREIAELARAEAAAKSSREQLWGSMSKANVSRRDAATQRGAKLVRNIGEATREEHEVNTANAARAALATSSIQPMEASLSRASQMQLRSSLQGALIRTSAEIKAEEMSYHAEMQAIDGELAILAQKVKSETDEIARARYLQDMQEASRQKEYFMDKAMDAQLRLQKASDPGFLKSFLPGLIQAGAGIVGAYFGGPVAGAAAAGLAKYGTDAWLSGREDYMAGVGSSAGHYAGYSDDYGGGDWHEGLEGGPSWSDAIASGEEVYSSVP